MPDRTRDHIEAIAAELERIGAADVTFVRGHELHWVIAGGESGPGFRMMQPEWALSLWAECHAAGVAFFLKQMSGREPIPADMMIRQFPV